VVSMEGDELFADDDIASVFEDVPTRRNGDSLDTTPVVPRGRKRAPKDEEVSFYTPQHTPSSAKARGSAGSDWDEEAAAEGKGSRKGKRKKKVPREKSVSHKRKLEFGSEDESTSRQKKKEEESSSSTTRKKKKRRGTSLPSPTISVTMAPEDESRPPRRSPRKVPQMHRFDPSKTGIKKRGLGRLRKEEQEQETQKKVQQKRKKETTKHDEQPKKTTTRSNKKKKKIKSESDEDEESPKTKRRNVTTKRAEQRKKGKENEKSVEEEKEDENDDDFALLIAQKKKKAMEGEESPKTKKVSPVKKTSRGEEDPTKETVDKAKEEEEAVLEDYFREVDETPLEEEEPTDTKWVSMPVLKSPQRLSKLAKHPAISKDYEDYKKTLADAQVDPVPITEFAKNLEDKRLEAVIQP